MAVLQSFGLKSSWMMILSPIAQFFKICYFFLMVENTATVAFSPFSRSALGGVLRSKTPQHKINMDVDFVPITPAAVKPPPARTVPSFLNLA